MTLPVPYNSFLTNPIQAESVANVINPNAFQVAQELKPYLQQIAVHSCNEIQQSAQKNPLRVVMFNMCSQQGWNNQTFQRLVANCAEYLYYAAGARNISYLSTPQAVQEISKFVSMSATQYLAQYPELSNAISRELHNACVTESQNLMHAEQLVKQNKLGGGVVGAPPGMVQPQAPQQMYNPQQPTYGTPPGYATMPPQQTGVAPTTYQVAQVQPNQPSSSGGAGSIYDDGPEITSFSSSATGQAAVTYKQPAPAQPPAQTPIVSATMSAPEPITSFVDDSDATINIGEQYFSYDIDYEINRPRDSPWGLVYHPSNQALVYVPTLDAAQRILIEEELLELGAKNVEYDQHKLALTFPPLPRDAEVSVADWSMIQTVEEVNVDNTGQSTETIDLKDGDIIMVDVSAVESTLLFGMYVCKDYFMTNFNIDGVDLSTRPFIFSAVTTDKVAFSRYNDGVTAKTLKHLLDDGVNLRRLQRILQTGQIDKGLRLSRPLIEIIDARATKIVNEAIQINMSLKDWAIGSFIDDYLDVKKALMEDFGQNMVEIFELHELEMMDKILQSMSASKYMKLDTENEDIVFTDYSAVLYLPWASDELNIQLPTDGPGCVLMDMTPKLFEAIRAFVTSTEIHNRCILTDDGVVIDVHEGWLAPDCYLLTIR